MNDYELRPYLFYFEGIMKSTQRPLELKTDDGVAALLLKDAFEKKGYSASIVAPKSEEGDVDSKGPYFVKIRGTH